MSFDQRALEWLRAHHATVAPATSIDGTELISPDRRRRLVTSGELERVVQGAYVFGGVALDELARCAAVCTSRPDLVIGGPTAARIWGFRRAPRDGLVHVIAPPASNPCRASWVRAYRTAPPAAEDLVRRADGIRVTSPPRTVVDMTRYVGATDLDAMIDHVLERGIGSEAALRRVARRLESPGRPWVRRFLVALALREGDAFNESMWERRVADELRRRGVTGLVAQHPVALLDHGRVRFDLAIPDLRWALEIDVHPEHRSLEGAARDNGRDAAAEAAGWAVKRIAELQLTRSFGPTSADILRTIVRRRATAR